MSTFRLDRSGIPTQNQISRATHAQPRPVRRRVRTETPSRTNYPRARYLDHAFVHIRQHFRDIFAQIRVTANPHWCLKFLCSLEDHWRGVEGGAGQLGFIGTSRCCGETLSSVQPLGYTSRRHSIECTAASRNSHTRSALCAARALIVQKSLLSRHHRLDLD